MLLSSTSIATGSLAEIGVGERGVSISISVPDWPITLGDGVEADGIGVLAAALSDGNVAITDTVLAEVVLTSEDVTIGELEMSIVTIVLDRRG